MRELGLTGLSEDGRFLVAHDALTDESFHIPTDDRLTSLLDARSANSTSDDLVSDGPTSNSPTSNSAAAQQPDRQAGTREPTMETTLSPRDIQTRIRRGESPEQVAESSGMPLDKVQPFAVPVMAEREYVVEQARATSVRRLHASGSPGLHLGSLVDASLTDQGVSAEAATWDSWRREDGRWTVIVSPTDDATTATFLYDTKGRYVVPADDAAHELIGDALQEVQSPAASMAIADAVREVAEQQPSAPASTMTVVVEEVAEVPAAAADEAPQLEPSHHVPVTDRVDDMLPNYDDIEYELPIPEEIIERSAPVSSLKEARDRRALEQLALSIDSEAAAPAEAADVEITEEHDVAVPSTSHPSQHAPKKRHERRRVPSWDEIMFGGATQD